MQGALVLSQGVDHPHQLFHTHVVEAVGVVVGGGFEHCHQPLQPGLDFPEVVNQPVQVARHCGQRALLGPLHPLFALGLHVHQGTVQIVDGDSGTDVLLGHPAQSGSGHGGHLHVVLPPPPAWGGGGDEIVDVAGVDVVAEAAQRLLDTLEQQHLCVPVRERLPSGDLNLFAGRPDLLLAPGQRGAQLLDQSVSVVGLLAVG